MGLVFTASAQIHTETGDAGDRPETAQATGAAACQNPITQINGTHTADDVDMYAICIPDPAAFSATTVGGATWDTQLWLFNANGLGVVFNDDNPAGGLQSRITGALVPAAGTYYLAISRYDRDAQNCSDAAIWADTPFNTERAPDGPGAAGRVGSWGGATAAGGAYSIFLTGVRDATPVSLQACPPYDGWDEASNGGGDAGDLPANAQKVHSSDSDPCQTPVNRIRGNHGADDVDMYVICITNPAAFVASTVGGTAWDTQLWLFNCDGTGVAFNDDSTGLQSTIDNSAGCITRAGNYHLAVSRYNRDAVDASGGLIWNNTPFAGVRCPDGPGAANPIAGWTGATAAGGVYVIELQGAHFVSEAGCVDEPECEGDDDGNGCVDDADLLSVLFNFGSFGIGIPGDVNNDFIVDDRDLLIVLFNFGCGC
jgi:hypothetical protein